MLIFIQLAVLVVILPPSWAQYLKDHYPQHINLMFVKGNCEIASHHPNAWARIQYYEGHNRPRSGLALGVTMFNHSHGFPKRMMKLMAYDCNLEQFAARLLYKNNNNLIPGHAVNRYEKNLTDPSKWRDEVGTSMLYWINHRPSFIRLTYQTSTFMGCAYKVTRQNEKYDQYVFRVFCVYSRSARENLLAKPIPGRACIRDNDCGIFGTGYRCHFNIGLCYTTNIDHIYWVF